MWLPWLLFLAVEAIEVSVGPQGPQGEISLLQRHMATSSIRPTQLLAYYINVDTEVERRKHMEAQVRAAGLPLLRFQAISQERINSGKFDQKYVLKQKLSSELLNPAHGDHLVNAPVACYVSHNELLEELQRVLQPNQIGLVLEDDVEIPHNWAELIDNTLSCAPSDWSLLKVSGWGYSRPADLQEKHETGGIVMNQTSMALLSWLQSQGGWMSRILYGAPAKSGSIRKNITQRTALLQVAAQAFAGRRTLVDQLKKTLDQVSPTIDDIGDMDDSQDDLEEGRCPDAYLMRRPFKETFWWHFWGPAFHYAGTGAYLVKASSIPAVLTHLRSQPINDVDGMLLSQGDLRAYELWPHIFPLDGDHMSSTMQDPRRNHTGAGLFAKLSHLFPGGEEGKEDETGQRGKKGKPEQRLVRAAARAEK